MGHVSYIRIQSPRVDNVVMIDRWDSTCNETSATIALKPHVFYNLKLEYKEVTGTAFVRMSWSSQVCLVDIASSCWWQGAKDLYIDKNRIPKGFRPRDMSL
jgi:hypothetical protein